MSAGLLETLGVRIRRVAELDEGALYIQQCRLLLLDIELTDKQVTEAQERVLPHLTAPAA